MKTKIEEINILVHDVDADGYCSAMLMGKFVVKDIPIPILKDSNESVFHIQYIHNSLTWLKQLEGLLINLDNDESLPIKITFLDCFPQIENIDAFTKLVKYCNLKVTVIDHHISRYDQIAQCSELVDTGTNPLTGIVTNRYRLNGYDFTYHYSSKWSTAMMVNLMFDLKDPLAEYVDDWDSWKHKLKETVPIALAINEYIKHDLINLKLFLYQSLTDKKYFIKEQILKDGKRIMDNFTANVDEFIEKDKVKLKRSYPEITPLENNEAHTRYGKTLLVGAIPFSTSLTGWYLYNKYPEYEFITLLKKTKDGYVLSFRSKDSSELSLGEMCSNYGGGGHHHAAGFTTPDVNLVNDFLTGKK